MNCQAKFIIPCPYSNGGAFSKNGVLYPKGKFPALPSPSSKIPAPTEVDLFVADEQHLCCSCSHPVYGPVSVTLREKSVVYSICDFLEYMLETDMVYSRKESESILLHRLEEFTKNIENHTEQEE